MPDQRSSIATLAALLGSAALAQAPADATAAASAARALQADFVAIAAKVFPSVVTVRAFARVDGATAPATAAASAHAARATAGPAADGKPGWTAATANAPPDYPGFRLVGSCSGFFVGAAGDVVTALRPLQVAGDRMADLIEVETNDGVRAITATVGIEPTLDLAIVHCAVFDSWQLPAMTPLRFADSEALSIGSIVLGFGDPAGPERFLATGLLVAKPSRDCYQEMLSATYLQATMTVPAPARGGPLVDLDGGVVGILADVAGTDAGAAPRTGWALPSKILSGLCASIRAAGTMRSPWLGFSVMSRAELATSRGIQAFQAMAKPAHGIMIENVFQPSPAAAAGVQPGDFLTRFDGVDIHAPVEFQRQLYLAGIGRKVLLEFFRAGTHFRQELTIEARPPEARPR